MEKVRLLLMDIEKIADSKELIIRMLSEEDINQSEKYIKESDKLLHIGSAYLKKKCVDGTISIDSHGKPKSNRCHFNISHSHDVVGVVITANHEVGLDIETKEELNDDVKKYCLSDHEVNQLGKDSAIEYFVSKESLAKAEGTGLPNDMKSVPALPLDGKVEYKGKKYYRHKIFDESHCISITLEGADFEI